MVVILSIAEAIVIAGFLIYRESARLTFDDITNNLFSQYDHANWSDNANHYEGLELYVSCKFEPYSGDLGSTAHRKCLFYDVDDNLLFEITGIGNRNIIQFTIDGETKTYIGNKGKW